MSIWTYCKKIYGELITTPEIADEYGEKLPEWIKIESVSDKKYQEYLETQIDWGEASAIALAKEYDDVFLLLDDLKARKLAIRLNLKIGDMLTNDIRRDFIFVHPEYLASDKYSIKNATFHLNNIENFQDYKLIIVPAGKTISLKTL